MIRKRGWFRRARGTALAAALAAVTLGFGTSNASAKEPIVGLWSITVKDSGGNVVDKVFSTWTSDGLESDQDNGSPILTGNVCYGTWVKLGGTTTGSPIPSSPFRTSTPTERGRS